MPKDGLVAVRQHQLRRRGVQRALPILSTPPPPPPSFAKATSFGRVSNVQPRVATDSSGNFYVCLGVTTNSIFSNFGTLGTTGTPPLITPADTITLGALAGVDALIIKYNSSGVRQWDARIGGLNNESIGGIATDSSGNCYVIGQFSSSDVFFLNANGSTWGNFANDSGGTGDIFIVKYNTNGVIQWATRIAGTNDDVGTSIATDSFGNCYVTGSFISSSLSIYNATAPFLFGTLSSSGPRDVFIVKYNTSGTAQWAARIGGGNNDVGTSIAADSTGCYVTGYYNPDVTIYNSDGAAARSFSSIDGNTRCFVVKYGTDGIYQWASRIGGGGIATAVGYGIASDSSGNCYVTGYYTSTVTITNTDTSIGGTLVSSGSSDVFIVKYNTSGTAQWVATITGTSIDQGYSVATDSSGNCYVTGYYVSSILINSSNNAVYGTLVATLGVVANTDTFIVKYNTNGVVQWATRIAGAGSAGDEGYSVATDSSGNCYVMGLSNSLSITINSRGTLGSEIIPVITPTPYGTLNRPTNDLWAFIVKYDTNGQL